LCAKPSLKTWTGAHLAACFSRARLPCEHCTLRSRLLSRHAHAVV
jgi:hypothetical protein